MDLETENRIAAILLKEAAELRRQAQKEGALAYLSEPTVRSRPNSRFLTATVRGVQQANRAVEVNEMWRLREKQLELDNKLRGKRESNNGRGYKDNRESHTSTSRECNEVDRSASDYPSSKKRPVEDFDPMGDEGLKDDEIDQFLQSRVKRGRGSVGSRMDETGPYLPLGPDPKNMVERDIEMGNRARVMLGPQKPYSLMSSESSDDERHPKKKKKSKGESSKSHTRKHKSKEKSRDKRKRKDKKSKHHSSANK